MGAFILLFSTSVTTAQVNEYREADSISYSLFMANKFPELKQFGKNLLSQGIDFYYLRVRLALANFYSNNFEAALPHYLKAVEMNPSDPVILNQTYLCLLYTSQYQRANAFALKYLEVDARIAPKYAALQLVELEVGRASGSNATDYETAKLSRTGNGIAIGNFFSEMDYGRIYLEGIINPDLKILGGAGAFQNNHLSRVEAPGNGKNQAMQDLNSQFNMGLLFQGKNGWNFALATGHYRQAFTYLYLINQSPPLNGTGIYTLQNSAFSFSGSVARRIPFFEPGIALHFSGLDEISRSQADLQLSTYPFGNGKWFTTTAISFLADTTFKGLAFSQKAGWIPNANFSLELSFLSGALDNYSGNLGFLMLNTFDPILWAAGIHVRRQMGRKSALQTGYRYQVREGSYYFETTSGVPGTNYYTYFTNQLYLNIQWLF